MPIQIPPLPFHIGNDICQIPRIYRILVSKRGPQFIHRVLTAEEQQQPRCKEILQHVSSKSLPKALPQTTSSPTDCLRDGPAAVDQKNWRAAEFMAGRFAAKEAAIKAHPHRELTFRGISILRHSIAAAAHQQQQHDSASLGQDDQPARKGDLDSSGNDPRSSGPPVALIKGDDDYEDCYASISISHDGDYATAVCLGYSQSPRQKARDETG